VRNAIAALRAKHSAPAKQTPEDEAVNPFNNGDRDEGIREDGELAFGLQQTNEIVNKARTSGGLCTTLI